MALLVLHRGGHQQRQDLVVERARPRLPRLVLDPPYLALPHRRHAVRDL